MGFGVVVVVVDFVVVVEAVVDVSIVVLLAIGWEVVSLISPPFVSLDVGLVVVDSVVWFAVVFSGAAVVVTVFASVEPFFVVAVVDSTAVVDGK